MDIPIMPVPVPEKKEVVLTDEQEAQMLSMWNASPNTPPGLKQLTQRLFGHECDGRSLEGRAVKRALAKHSLRAKSTYDKERELVLSEEQKIYITNNVKSMSAIEMARILFNDPHLSPLHGEVRIVNSYIKSILPTVAFSPGQINEPPAGPYEPPKTITEALTRVNSYINLTFDKDKLTPQQKKNLWMLIGYMHTYRFIAQMNTYVSENDRKLAEDAFVRATFDKPDLAQEEIDQYIEYANQVVNGFIVQRRSNQLQANLEDIASSNDDNLKISMSLVEAIGKAGTEYQQCLGRQQKLLDDLKEKRSARLGKQIKENASILNLIQAWRSEEGRKELMKHAEKEQAAVASEVEKLSSLSDLKCRVLGLSKDEIMYE